MLIANHDHLMRAGVCSLDEQCPYCGLVLADYPLVMSDDVGQTCAGYLGHLFSNKLILASFYYKVIK